MKAGRATRVMRAAGEQIGQLKHGEGPSSEQTHQAKRDGGTRAVRGSKSKQGMGTPAARLRKAKGSGSTRDEGVSNPQRGMPRYRTRWIAWSFILAAMIGCAAAALIRGGALEWYAFCVLLGVTLFSGALPVVASRGLSAVRILPSEATVAGEEAVIRVEMKRRWRFPFVWITVEEAALNEAMISPAVLTCRVVAIPGSDAWTGVAYAIPNLRRGVYSFRDMTVTVGDWLGLTAIRTTIAARDELLVWPSMPVHEGAEGMQAVGASAEDVSSTPEEATADWRGTRGDDGAVGRLQIPGPGPDSRPYREGDSIRHLDYRAAARGRGLRIKASMPERSEPAALLIDTSAASYGHDDARFDASLGRAALEAKELYEAGVRVKVITASWTFELNGEDTGRERLNELLGLFGRLRADSEESGERREEWLSYAALPARGAVHVFSGNWRQVDRWLPLSAYAAEQGGRPALYLAMEGKTVTSGMRDNQKELEKHGVKVRWLPLDEPGTARASAGEGADSYAIG